MFKSYTVKWGKDNLLRFFVRDRVTRGGFLHEACVFGELPGPDGREIPDSLEALTCGWSRRYARVLYKNRTWERWAGQACLVKLWDNLAKVADMSRVQPENPFADGEPPAEDLWDPVELFGRFSERKG